jgi:LacI family transcriptional regulator
VNSTATVADIAARAGVGTATVDRVLNKRAGVNPDTVKRVLQVVAEMGGPAPRGRPRSQNLRFAYVLPAEAHPFTDMVERHIAQAAGDFRHQHITEVTHRLAGPNASAFAEGLSRLSDCEGIALMAPDLPAVKLAVAELVRKGVHVVTLFSDVAGSMRETHIGADNRAAGRTAGLLLGRMAPAGGADTLLLVSTATRLSAEIERRIGFAQVIEERFAHLRMVRVPDIPADDAGAAKVLTRFLRKDIESRSVAGLYCVGPGAAGLLQALASLPQRGALGVVAHDLNDSHRGLLASGALSYLLDQDIHYCVLAAARVLRALCENVRGALNVVQPRIEILTAENLH